MWPVGARGLKIAFETHDPHHSTTTRILPLGRRHALAGDYKQFIFPLLFYKRLCDVFDEETVTALRESGGDQDFVLFPENHRFQVPADAHWREIRKVSRDVGRGLQQAMRAIETAKPDKLFGIFGDAQWTNKDRLAYICGLITSGSLLPQFKLSR